MSSQPEGDVVPKVELPLPDSQLSETIAGSQSFVTAPSQGTPNVSQELPDTADSVVSSTVQDHASQSQPSQLFSQVAPSTTSADTDASMMPPPTPTNLSQGAGANTGLARSSGRAIKPTLKLRGDDEDSFPQRSQSGSSSQGIFNGSQSYGFRNRKSSAQGSNSNARAPRLKLNLKGGHASRGKGDPTLTGVNKTLPYMRGYDRELDSSDDETTEGLAFEEQIILRMPEGHEATKTLGDWVRRREVGNDGREVEVKFKDSRRAVFKIGDKQFSSKLVDLPAIIESHKTLDNKQVFKIADISQMLLVTHQIQEESEVTRGDGLEKVEGLTDDFIYDHGITPPMKWARKRRFRQRIHKRTIETVEKEVERLLAEDERAENVEYAMIDMAEVDLSDSDEEGGGRLIRGDGGGSQAGSQGATPSIAPDGASNMSDLEDEFSQMGEQEESGMGMEDDDVDQDLQRELEQEMLLQQQEDEEDEDEEGSTRNSMRGRSMSRATSEDDDDEDDEEEDDLFDAGDEEEGAAGGDAEKGENEVDDDDDDMDEEEQEQRVRETQLEAECKEIEAMVKRKSTEVEITVNTIIKQRNLQTLKRMQTELDMKKSQLLDLRQQRREGKEAAKAEAQAQAEEAAAIVANRTSSSATPNSAAVVNTASNGATIAPASAAAVSTSEVIAPTEREKGPPTAKETTTSTTITATRKPVAAANDMDVDADAEGEPEEDGEEDDDEDGSDESDLFG